MRYFPDSFFASVLIALLGATGSQAASCPAHPWTAYDQVKLNPESVLIVTHPSTQWDGRFVSKLGMDATVAMAKKSGIPVVYLQDTLPTNASSYFFSDCNPNYWVASVGGEFFFPVPSKHVISVGGHWEMCQRNTLGFLFRDYWQRSGDLRLTQVMDGIYSYPTDFMSKADPYFPSLLAFLAITTYGRPDSWPFPKTSLLENMGIIKDKALQVAYLKRNLPPYEKLPARYGVRLVLNGEEIETLRKPVGSNPAMLTLEFINSVYKGGPIPDAFGKPDPRGRCQTVGCLRSRSRR